MTDIRYGPPPPAVAAAAAGVVTIPPGLNTGGQNTYLIPIVEDTLGAPTRCAVVAYSAANNAKIITYSFRGGAWFLDPAVDAQDPTVTVGVTSSNIARMHAFAIESPGTATVPVVFIETHDVAGTPDTFAIRSVLVADADTTLVTVGCTIAGANAPPDTNLGGTMSVPVTTNRIMTFFQDDIYFGDITGAGTGGDPFTITYTDAPVLAYASVDVSSANVRKFSGALIGTQVVLLRAGAGAGSNAMWELTPAGVLTQTLDPFNVGGMGVHLDQQLVDHAMVFPHDGSFQIASPFAGGASNGAAAYLLSPLPLDDI